VRTEPLLSALRVLSPQLDSARNVLTGRPEAILKWLEIWAHKNAPAYDAYLEKIHEAKLEASLHRGPDVATWDLQSEVFY
jgi:hypothetical protein